MTCAWRSPERTCCGRRASSRTAGSRGRSRRATRSPGPPTTGRSSFAYQGGAPVRLSDVARVTDDVEDRFNTGFFNKIPAVLLDHQPAAGRQHHQDGGRDPRAAARAARVPSSRRRAQHRQRPVAGDPRDAAGCGAHAARRRLARDSRRAPLPRERACGRDSGRRGAGRARRQLRRHVPVRILAQQPLAHGAHRCHRARRGRCDRGARKHFAPRGIGQAALRGGARRRARGRGSRCSR